jgi:hypothetical protein
MGQAVVLSSAGPGIEKAPLSEREEYQQSIEAAQQLLPKGEPSSAGENPI